MGTIWVHAETKNGEVSTITLELLTKARELGEVVAVHAGSDAEAAALQLGAYGASRVLSTGDLDGGLIGPALASALSGVIGEEAPQAILFGTTYGGRDVAGRLSVKLDAPVITNIVDLVDEDGLTGVEPVFGGTTNVRTRFTGEKVGIFLVRPKSFVAESAGGDSAAVSMIAVPDLGNTGAAKVHNQFVEESDGPKLDEASIVVSGGRGLGEAEKYHLIEDLAKRLGGAAGASRAIVDAGWVPYSYQVGQTGKVVKPDVYIAAGISGATQHMVGMKGSKTIIAINKDSEAPIFSIADLGIVGDVHKVLPALLEALGES
ncbi:MAG: electron transfer flavoprotein subunit alpha/FixB family protein [Acidimicrobiales bacterium]|nr:electron transfer flavoprotein subunit alpha/FixB family protein [Acidimicrobiales bacterium]MDG1846065.1 electron transfer flavoprotein subunit alpha/FixB family protein [Acidimicrobiales bacterium]